MQTRKIKSAIVLKAPLKLVFDTFFKFDFLQIFNELRYVSNFAYVILSQEALRPGKEHIIYFDNGNTAKVKLKTFLPEMSFSAEVYDFVCHRSGLQEIEYVFCFSEDLSSNISMVTCEYQFKFRWKFRAFLFEVLVRKHIQKNLEKVLEITAKPFTVVSSM